jgi:hypothetical protein
MASVGAALMMVHAPSMQETIRDQSEFVSEMAERTDFCCERFKVRNFVEIFDSIFILKSG